MANVWAISNWEITLRLVVAAILGGLIGWEREKNNHPAGFRTHILVSLGSSLIMLISIYGFVDYISETNIRFDPSRLSAQVVSGIGFLGAGTILRHGLSVTGLTTAASLWVVSGIGLAVGAGFMFGAVLTTGLVLVSLELLNRLEAILIKKKGLHVIHLYVSDEPGKLGEVASLIASKGVSICRVISDKSEKDYKFVHLTFTIKVPKKITMTYLYEEIMKIKGVKSIDEDRHE